MRARYCLFSILCLSTLLAGCHSNKIPKKNPQPKYFVTISGNISPSLPKPVYYVVWATYAANKPQCKRTINWIEGVKAYYGKTDRYSAQPDKNGDYIIKIPIDRYLPGRCEWSIYELDYDAETKKIPENRWDAGQNSLMFFNNSGALGSLPVHKNVSGILCRSGQDFFCGGETLSPGNPEQAPLNQNYYFTQNFK